MKFKGLPAGTYTVDVLMKGLANDHEVDVAVAAAQVVPFDIVLSIQVQQEQVQVQAESNNVTVSPDRQFQRYRDQRQRPRSSLRRSRRIAIRTRRPCRTLGRSEWRPDLYRWLHRRAASAEILDPRNPRQPESLFRAVRQAGLWPHRNSHQAGHGQVSRPVLFQRQRRGIQFAQSFRPTEPGYHSEIFDGNFGGPITRRRLSSSTRSTATSTTVIINARRSGLHVHQPPAPSRRRSQSADRTNISPRMTTSSPPPTR